MHWMSTANLLTFPLTPKDLPIHLHRVLLLHHLLHRLLQELPLPKTKQSVSFEYSKFTKFTSSASPSSSSLDFSLVAFFDSLFSFFLFAAFPFSLPSFIGLFLVDVDCGAPICVDIVVVVVIILLTFVALPTLSVFGCAICQKNELWGLCLCFLQIEVVPKWLAVNAWNTWIFLSLRQQKKGENET